MVVTRLTCARSACSLTQSLTFFLRLLALDDIDSGAYELNEIAGWTENRVSYCVDVF